MAAKTAYDDLIRKVGASYRLDPELFLAQVVIESGGRSDAFRYELEFYRKYVRDNPRALAARFGPLAGCSYGLGQLMLETAYERGFHGMPHQLFDPQINLDFTARQMLTLITWAQKSGRPPDDCMRAALAAYNGGKAGNAPDDAVDRNHLYAEKVYAERDRAA